MLPLKLNFKLKIIMFKFKPQQTLTLTHKDRIIIINIKKLPNAKKISLKPCFKTYGGKIIIPSYISYAQAKNFAYKNIEWLYTILNNNGDQSILKLSNITLLGNNITIKLEDIKDKSRKNITLTNNTLTISLNQGNSTKTLKSIKKFFQKLSKDYIINKATYYANCMGVKYNKIIIRENVSRWGSCSAKKNISLNWRLIFAPKEVLDYVIIHEVAHLIYFNHGKDFWSLVKKFQLNFKESKEWLKQNGNSLYKITF